MIGSPSTDERVVTMAGRELPVLFTARARYDFERIAGYPLSQLKAWTAPDRPSDTELTHLLVAGLEGARVRAGDRKTRPWTLDAVLTLIDHATATDRGDALLVLIRAVGDAFDIGAQEEAGETAEGKAQTEG